MLKDQIRKNRLHLGISQCELARRTGYSHEFISQVERGIKSPSIKALQKIALGLGVSPSMLMEPRDKPESEAKLKQEIITVVNQLPSEKLKVIKKLLQFFPEVQEMPIEVKSPGNTGQPDLAYTVK